MYCIIEHGQSAGEEAAPGLPREEPSASARKGWHRTKLAKQRQSRFSLSSNKKRTLDSARGGHWRDARGRTRCTLGSAAGGRFARRIALPRQRRGC